ncbi:MAG: hypothetical protein ACE37B_02135 [Ilumatobacter sp.]|jgi:hypothetical protein|uniref:hypothetical protein n=1 Tax=Ilumatobacter sp. TaxID=1967498 RepID=UPI00391DA007
MAKKNAAPETPAKITPDDLRNKLQAFQGDVQGKVDDKKMSIAAVAGGAATFLMIIMFILGKRSGKKKSAVIEIRRV